MLFLRKKKTKSREKIRERNFFQNRKKKPKNKNKTKRAKNKKKSIISTKKSVCGEWCDFRLPQQKVPPPLSHNSHIHIRLLLLSFVASLLSHFTFFLTLSRSASDRIRPPLRLRLSGRVRARSFAPLKSHTRFITHCILLV